MGRKLHRVTPTMLEALDFARKNGGKLYIYDNIRWGLADYVDGATSVTKDTIDALVTRGLAHYSLWDEFGSPLVVTMVEETKNPKFALLSNDTIARIVPDEQQMQALRNADGPMALIFSNRRWLFKAMRDHRGRQTKIARYLDDLHDEKRVAGIFAPGAPEEYIREDILAVYCSTGLRPRIMY